MDIKRVLFCALVCLFIVGLAATAQTITGTLTGTVEDPAHAAIPGVKVVATNINTNVSHATVTNEAGVYTLPFLPVGQYNVTAEAPNFKKSVIGPVQLQVDQIARLDIQMELGAMTDTVQVTATAPILQTESTQTGDVINSLMTTSVPLNGRNFVSLTLLVPGTITPNPGSFTTPSRAFSGGRPYVNGNREQTNNFLLDGLEISETVDNLVGYNPSVDALEEIKVQTGNASAEFGNGNGAIVNMTTRSGSNAFHGGLFEFFRNDALDANTFFNNRSGASKRGLRQNIFGGTFGGPIKKNSLFFFVDYQGTRVRNSGAALATVLPQSMRLGDLSAFPNPIIDPQTGTQFTGNIIPPNRIVNPAALALFANPDLYPLPNNPGTGTIGITNNFLGASADKINNDQGDAKIDAQIGEKDMLSGRFTRAQYNSETTRVVIPTSLGTSVNAPTTLAVVTWTRTISPTMVNEARAGFARFVVENRTIDPAGVFGPNGNALLGIPGGQPIAGASAILIGEGITQIAGSPVIDSSTHNNTFQYSDTLTWIIGRHSLRMGFNALRYQQNRFYAGNNGLLGNFDFAAARYSRNGVADFLLNNLSAKGRGAVSGTWGQRQWRPGLFIQDDYKVTNTLTLNLGLRWEYTQPLYEVADRQTNVDLQTGAQIFPNGSRALYDSYWLQFMPRVGFAWSPNWNKQRFVLRGGYGITSFMEGTGANLRLTLNPPFFFESQTTFGLTSPGDISTGFLDVNPQNILAGQVRAWNPNLRPAFIQQANLSAEYQFAENVSLNVAYVGQRGDHLVNPREFNQPLPDPGPVSTWRPLQERRPLFATAPLITNISGTDSSGNMSYNALQVTGRHRLRYGLQFLASYTYSKTLTDNLGYYGSTGVAGMGAYWQDAYNRRENWGRAFFDATHNFTLGGLFEIPVGRDRIYGKNWNRWLDAAVGGWDVNYIVSAHSGFPITIFTNDQSNQAVRGNTRPNRFRTLTYENQTVDNWFGTGNTFCLTPGSNDGICAYGVPAVGTFGNSGVSTEHAPDFTTFDFVVAKRFAITESQFITFRAEFYNIFNMVNFGPPDRNISSQATFGQITTIVGTPRNIQFALKYNF